MNKVSATYMGGLGNRLFQFATSYAYSKKYNKECVIALNHSIENKQGKLHSNEYLHTIFSKIKKVDNFTNYLRIDEPGNKCISYFDLPNYEKNILLYGYFQCEKYFKHLRDEIIELLTFPKINESPRQNSIFVHVRRGDYILPDKKLHGGYNYEHYYRNALNFVFIKFKKLNVYIFSDDIEWCKQWDILKEYSEFSFYYLEMNELETLKFMSLCDRGGIGGNSSFSWWGGYLNNFENKMIIFPNQWFFEHPYDKYENDIVFEGCIKLTDKHK
jgi:hypothetical protein